MPHEHNEELKLGPLLLKDTMDIIALSINFHSL